MRIHELTVFIDNFRVYQTYKSEKNLFYLLLSTVEFKNKNSRVHVLAWY